MPKLFNYFSQNIEKVLTKNTCNAHRCMPPSLKRLQRYPTTYDRVLSCIVVYISHISSSNLRYFISTRFASFPLILQKESKKVILSRMLRYEVISNSFIFKVTHVLFIRKIKQTCFTWQKISITWKISNWPMLVFFYFHFI